MAADEELVPHTERAAPYPAVVHVTAPLKDPHRAPAGDGRGYERRPFLFVLQQWLRWTQGLPEQTYRARRQARDHHRERGWNERGRTGQAGRIHLLGLHQRVGHHDAGDRARANMEWLGRDECARPRHPCGALGEIEHRQHLLDGRSEEHTSELQSLAYLVCRLLLEKKKKISQAEPQPPVSPGVKVLPPR